jgi:uncharacterized Zn finger protein
VIVAEAGVPPTAAIRRVELACPTCGPLEESLETASVYRLATHLANCGLSADAPPLLQTRKERYYQWAHRR